MYIYTCLNIHICTCMNVHNIHPIRVLHRQMYQMNLWECARVCERERGREREREEERVHQRLQMHQIQLCV